MSTKYFSLYTSEERLGQDDAFFCPQCNKKREVVKKLGVWSVPDVLVIHLKRFSYNRYWRDKIDTVVEFPTKVRTLAISARITLTVFRTLT